MRVGGRAGKRAGRQAGAWHVYFYTHMHALSIKLTHMHACMHNACTIDTSSWVNAMTAFRTWSSILAVCAHACTHLTYVRACMRVLACVCTCARVRAYDKIVFLHVTPFVAVRPRRASFFLLIRSIGGNANCRRPTPGPQNPRPQHAMPPHVTADRPNCHLDLSPLRPRHAALCRRAGMPCHAMAPPARWQKPVRCHAIAPALTGTASALCWHLFTPSVHARTGMCTV